MSILLTQYVVYMLKKLLILFVLAGTFATNAQTFNGGGGAIQDFQTTDIPVAVTGLPVSINTTTFGLERVCINLTHTYVADLTLSIVAPDGNVIMLMSNNGGGGDDLTGTCFQWDAVTSIAAGGAPFTGSFEPIEELGFLNNGQNPNGTWLIRAYDGAAADQGAIIDCSITFSSNPADYFYFTESDLPIVVINTAGQGIPDEPKIEAQMGIIYNGPGMINHITDPYNNYNNKIGIEQRGSSSAGFPQKSYGFETRDVNGTQHDTLLLGMPKEHDWILYAPYNDKTCMRNILSYDIANKTGHYAPRTELCELVLNGQYKGIYVLMEKIKRDNNRVDIANLQPIDIAGDELTGGYIFKVDRDDGPGSYWDSPYPASSGQTIRFVHVEPKGDQIMPEQRTYIQAYVDSVEDALAAPDFTDPVNGYRKYIDVPSFVDYLLLNEASKNIDAYRLSAFFYKDKNSNGGKLVAGPAWDYNLAWWNADYCEAWTETNWVYEFNTICGGGYDVPFWWTRLMEDSVFQEDVKCRWTELRQTTLSTTALFQVIDSIAFKLDQAKDRHFNTWPLLGIYTWPNPSPIPADYPGEIQAMKDWIQLRFAWMDANLPGTCHLGLDEKVLSAEQITAWPNPFTESINVNVFLPTEQRLTITVSDMLGLEILRLPTTNFSYGEQSFVVNLPSGLANGSYLLNIDNGETIVAKKLLKSDQIK